MSKIKNYFYLFKIHHSIKNLSIFLPVIAAQSFSIDFLNDYIFSFFYLTFLSSIIYFFNNINDYEQDKKNKNLIYKIDIHKKKQYYLSGILTVSLYFIFLFFFDYDLLFILLSYFLLASIYNFKIKSLKYIDIFVIASFHLLRIFYGSIAFEVELTSYFIIFCLSIFLMIGANKRLVEANKNFINRPYKKNDLKNLNYFQVFFAIIAIVTFLFYILDSKNVILFHNSYLLYLNLIILIMIILNFLFFQKKEEDIVIFIYKNKLNFFLSMIFIVIFSYNSILF